METIETFNEHFNGIRDKLRRKDIVIRYSGNNDPMLYGSADNRYRTFRYVINDSALELLNLIRQGFSASDVYSSLKKEGASDEECKDIFRSIIDIVSFNYKSSSIEYNIGSETLQNPSSFAWDITNECNLRCRHCLNSSGKNESPPLSTKECLEVVRQLADMGVYLCWIGGGEPLLRKDIVEILHAMKKADIKVVLATNGLPCYENPDLISHLSELCDEINVSIDGATPESYGFLRGANEDYHKVAEVIRQIKLSGKAYVTAFACVHRRNLGEVGKMIDIACELGADKWMYNELSLLGRGEDIEDLRLDKDEMAILRKKLIEKEEEYDGRMYVSSYTRFQSTPPEKFKRISFNCSAGIELMTMDYKGDVYPCFKLEYPEFNCGSVRKKSLSDMWKNAEPFKIIRTLDPKKSMCWECEQLQDKLCNGGCLAEKYRVDENFYGLDPLCPYSSFS